jgi:DNA-binding protein Fis
MIRENEARIKDLITQLLCQEGYKVSESAGEGGVVQVIKRDNDNIAGIKDAIVELEKCLYDGKKGVLYKSILEIIEKPIIERVLERTEGNQFKAARILGINRNTMRTKIKKLGINPEIYKVSSY